MPTKAGKNVVVPARRVARATRGCALWAALVWMGCSDPVRTPEPEAVVPTPVSAAHLDDEEPDAAVPEDTGLALDAPDAPDARRTRASSRRQPAPLFDPQDDAAMLEALRSQEIVEVERGRGGRSIAFRVVLADGTRAYFKPEQTFSGMHWYAEIAAFHLDRTLGLNRTAPSTGRVVPWSVLEPAAAGDARVDEVIVGEDGLVRGALIAWIDERLVPLEPPPGWEQDLRLTPFDGVVPFVPLRELRREQLARDGGIDAGIDAGHLAGALEAGPMDAGLDAGAAEGWDRELRASELSELIVFDFLIHNGDRWGGNFTNVRLRGVDGPLIYLDNAAGFSRRRARLSGLDARLAFVQRFGSTFVRRLRRFDVERFEERLSGDPLAPILDEQQLTHLEERREAVLNHVDDLVEAHGAEVLPW